MIANTYGRRLLALLAFGAWLTAFAPESAVGQDRRYADENAQDRRYDEGIAGLNEIGPVDRNGQTRPATQPGTGKARPGEVNPGQANRPQAGAGQPNGGQAAAGQQPNRPLQPVAPFQLNAQQQRFVDELLAAWEKHSAGIKTFECEFSRWEYTPSVGPVNAAGQLQATAISSGIMKYIKPDKGIFHVTETRIFNKTTGKYDKAADDVGEHWVCDGKSVWEVDSKLKQLRENAIPPEMQGTQIANGPLPFMLFGGEAAKLKARYFLREQTNPQFAKEEIWLESYPRWAADAANYKSAHLIMKRADFLPYALRMYSPNGTDYTVFEFRKIKLNNVFMSDIKVPKVPSDYQIIRAQPPVQAAQKGPGAAVPQ